MIENPDNKLQLEIAIVYALKHIYDPEIPVNIYDLGLIYEVNVDEQNNVNIKMTMTSPNCPMADSILDEVKDRIKNIEGVQNLTVNLVFDPPWDRDMMTEEAKLELGFL